MDSRKRNLVGLTFAVILTLFWGLPAWGAEYPTKPITLVVPAVAGGSTDLTGRALAEAARKYLGQPFIFDNKGGGGGSAGPTLVASKPPDGYTLGVLRQAATMNAYHLGTLNFHPLNALTYIICFTGQWQGIVVRSDSPWKTIQDFVIHCKQNPKKVTYGTSGVGSGSHLVMEDFLMQAGIQMVHIPYKGNAETNTALLGGHLDCVNSSPGWAPLVDAGKFRLLVTSGLNRADRYPQVPTFKEVGYDVVNESPVDMIGPKGLPKPIVKKLHDAFKKGMDDPEFRSTLQKLDMSAIYMGPEELVKNAKEEFEKTGKITQKLGLQKKQ
jgi:tripartite-type tricarboxylate transporter receptor subunit TctC